MRSLGTFAVAMALVCTGHASWYWPFGSDDKGNEPPRISELMEEASTLIDEAADLAADGKFDESVEKYRKALSELDRVELENPDRASSPEFATLRNKRAYVNAAIDSMLLSQVRANAKAVAVSDTTELEKKFAEERKGKSDGGSAATKKAKPETEEPKAGEKSDEGDTPDPKVENPAEKEANKSAEEVAPKSRPKVKPVDKKQPSAQARRERAMAAVESGDYATAERLIDEMLAEKPNGAVALNLKAAVETRQGKFKEAEDTLDRAIMSNPRNYSAYYNMARLLLKTAPDDRVGAKRYYETGRTLGGPVAKDLEDALK